MRRARMRGGLGLGLAGLAGHAATVERAATALPGEGCERMSTALWIFAVLVAASIGWQAHGGWLEARHDCLPHDPADCAMKGTSDDG
jgi:hypothetical protein